jgi:hypothetical protein
MALPDLNSDVSEYDAGSPLLEPVRKSVATAHCSPSENVTGVDQISLESSSYFDEMIETTHNPISTTSSFKNFQREKFPRQSRYADSDEDENNLAEPDSDSESVGDYDMAQSEDEEEDNITAFDDTEEWEVIDKEVYDHTTNDFKQIPSTIFADDSIQQTLMNYVEMYKPTEHQIEQFKNALGVLKFVAEYGYTAIKEPIVDWAESVVRGKLNCGLDEIPKLFLARLLSRMPERTRNLLVRVPG